MPSIRALVVDDSPAMRAEVVAALRAIDGCSCVEAGDGAEGLRILGTEAFDIVVTDLNMPLLGGLALVQFIRNRPATRELPVVVVTSESAEEDRRRLAAAGANAYIIKPVDAGTLRARVREILGLS